MQGAKIHLGHGFLLIVGWALEGGRSLVARPQRFDLLLVGTRYQEC
jgi:hypothetical protein